MTTKRNLILAALLCLGATAATAQTHESRGFHLSFISPLGTNGIQSHVITNKVSFNILGGYSYGNTVFEFGGLYNVNTHLTKGFQFAGILNYTGNSQNAAQFAGIANVAPKGVAPFQFAGIANIGDTIKGTQLAGITNYAREVQGAQFGGIANYGEYTQNAVQFAGIANIAAKGTTPFQAAGIANVADVVKGAQFGGIANIADSTKGLQAAAIVNVTEKLHGVQLGLVNYADESHGVSIGLINIVKNGGKQEFEISFSEILNTTANFKLGTNRFYTIFSVGVNYIHKPVEYAVGIGFGTHIDWKKGWGNQIEAIGYSVTEKGSFKDTDLNMLTQLKFIVSKKIANHFTVFAGPVFNMTISKYIDPETGTLRGSLSPWHMWKNDSENTRLYSWIGFSIGARF